MLCVLKSVLGQRVDICKYCVGRGRYWARVPYSCADIMEACGVKVVGSIDQTCRQPATHHGARWFHPFCFARHTHRRVS